jgi:choline dehydrogenase-like flavoprotein
MEQADVVLIGSGYGGAIPAARLAEAGMKKVVVLERGPRWSTKDFEQSDDPRYITRVLELVVGKNDMSFRTGMLVGGASVTMDGAHFRMPARSYEARDSMGRRHWPAVYDKAELAPYFARAEKMLMVRQLAWTEISKCGGLFAKMLAAAGASCDRARMNYADCVQCGFCAQGCTFNRKVTLLHLVIPFAEAHGAELRSGCLVDHLEPSGTGYLVSYAQGADKKQIWGQRVFVAGGGIHSPALLLRSRPWLPKLSAQTGENFNNNGEHAFVGILPPEFDDLSRYGCFRSMDNAGMMTYHWLESDGFTLHPGGGLEPSIYASDLKTEGHPIVPTRSWGMAFKRFAETTYPRWLIAFSSLGMADGHQAVTVDAQGAVAIVERDRSRFDAYLDRVEAVVEAVGKTSGITLLPAVPRRLTGTTAAHLLCTCRMAESVAEGVVDADCQVFGHENLYCCDAAAIPYALGVNPALTVAALAERTAAKVIAKG